MSSTWCGSSQIWCPLCWLSSSWPSTGKSHTKISCSCFFCATNYVVCVEVAVHLQRATGMHIQMCLFCRWRERGLACSSCSRARLENGTYGQFRTGANRFDASRCEVSLLLTFCLSWQREAKFGCWPASTPRQRKPLTWQPWLNTDPQHNSTTAELRRNPSSSSCSFTVRPPRPPLHSPSMLHNGSCVARKSLCCSTGLWRKCGLKLNLATRSVGPHCNPAASVFRLNKAGTCLYWRSCYTAQSSKNVNVWNLNIFYLKIKHIVCSDLFFFVFLRANSWCTTLHSSFKGTVHPQWQCVLYSAAHTVFVANTSLS